MQLNKSLTVTKIEYRADTVLQTKTSLELSTRPLNYREI